MDINSKLNIYKSNNIITAFTIYDGSNRSITSYDLIHKWYNSKYLEVNSCANIAKVKISKNTCDWKVSLLQ